ncbi:MAG: hypothetical protein QXU98_08745, partial [Candidatus Parvarchaeota archaeon]
MFKPNNKKLLTVLIAVAMIFSAFAVLSIVAQPAYAQTASGQFYATTEPSSSPTVSGGSVITPLASPAPMIFIAEATTTAAVFTAGQTVDFYWSTTTAASGIVGGVAGSTTASPAGTISGAFILKSVPSTPGKYYLLAASEGDIAGGVASSTDTLTVTEQVNYPIKLQLSLNEVTYSSNVTSTFDSKIYFEGSGFESTASGSVILSVWTETGIAPATSFSISAATPSSGMISGSFIIPADPMGYYYVIAYDSESGLATGQAILGIEPSVSPILSIPENSVSFATVTLTGEGFPSTATFAPSTVATPSNTLTIGGVDAILSGTPSVSASGSVTFSIDGLASAITTTGPMTVVINDQQGQPFPFPDQAYVSSPTGVPTLVVYDAVFGTTSGYVGDTLTAVMFNFLASSTAAVSLDGQSFTMSPLSTDSNGFDTGTLTLADIPGGTYTVFATASSSTGSEFASASFNVLPRVKITDS